MAEKAPEAVAGDAVVMIFDSGDTSRPSSSPPSARPLTGPAPAAHETRCLRYFSRWRGVPGKKAPPRAHLADAAWTLLGCGLAIWCLAAVHFLATDISRNGLAFVVASFGASAVLVYGVPHVPLAQPRNLVGGHILSACVGVALRQLLVELPGCEDCRFVAAGLAVACSTSLMMLTGLTHPPGGATALIAVIGDRTIQALGWMYVLIPIASGAFIMLGIGLVVNNLSSRPGRSYPLHW